MRKTTFAFILVILLLAIFFQEGLAPPMLDSAGSRSDGPTASVFAAQNQLFTYTEDFSRYDFKAYTEEAKWDVFDQYLSLLPMSGGAHREPDVAPDGYGGAYIVWGDLRNNNANGNWDVYAQRVDSRGNRLWANDLRVNSDDAAAYQGIASVVTTSQGNAIAIWVDDRDDRRAVYAQKLSPDGTKLWSSDVRINGEPSYRMGSGPYIMDIAIDAQDNVIVVWQGHGDGDWVPDVYAQKIDTDGQRMWSQDVQVNESVDAEQRYMAVDVDSNGNSVIAWVDGRNGGEDIYAQRLDAAGNRIWSTDVKISAGAGISNQGDPNVAMDASDNAIVVWRNGLPKPPVDQQTGTIYAQRIAEDGQLAWEGNVRVNRNTTSTFRGEPRAASIPGGDVLVLWEDNRQGYGNNDIFVQRLSASGNLLWLEDVQVSPPEWGGIWTPALSIEGHEAYVAWSRTDHVYVQRFDIDAQRPILPVPVRINEFDGTANQIHASISSLSDGRVLVTWDDLRRSTDDVEIRAQMLDTTGAKMWPNSFQVNGAGETVNQWRSQVATNQDDNSLVVWNDDRGGIYGQLLDETGNRTWTEDKPINVDDRQSKYPAIAAMSDTTFVVAWLGLRDGSTSLWDIYVQRIDETGTRLWTTDQRVNSGDYYINEVDARSRPDVAIDAEGHIVVVWRGDTGNRVDIFAQRLAPDGSRDWEQEIALNAPVFALPGRGGDVQCAVAADSEIAIAWSSRDASTYGIQMQRLDLDGNRLWDAHKWLSSSDEAAFYGNPDLVSLAGGDVIAVWDDERYGRKLYAQRIGASGDLVWEDELHVNRNGWPLYTSLSRTPDGNLVVAWHDERFGNDNVYTQRFSPDGTVLWESDVTLLSAESFYYPVGTAESITIGEITDDITKASLNVSQSLNGGRVDYYLSNDGGQTWEKAVPGELHTFESRGSDLRWKARLYASSDGKRAPTVDELMIRYGDEVEGDAFEPDDICDQAQIINTDGTVQKRAFYDDGDIDWGSFNAVADTTYLIEARVPESSNADISLEVFDQCDELPQDGQNYAFTPEVRLKYTPITDTRIYLKLTNHDPSEAGTDVTYNLSIRAQNPEDMLGAVVIVAGRYEVNDHLQDQINNVANEMYQLFLDHGYSEDRIYYLAADQGIDANKDGTPDVDALISRSSLKQAITSWALDTLDPNSPFTLYMVDHGTYDTLYLDRPRGEDVAPHHIDNWLGHLEEAVPGVTVNVIVEACNSGSFIDSPKTLSKSGRVVIASTGARNVAWASEDGAVFSDHFIATLRQQTSLYNSFEAARSAARSVHPNQTPWIDDDGDGVANEAEDGQVAQRRGFMYPGTLAPNERIQWPPYIVQASGPKEVDNHRGVIKAEVRDDGRVEYVTGVIYKPSYEPPEESDELVQEDLPTIRLLDQDNDGVYSAVYEGFDEIGVYRIVVYATDAEGLEARPYELAVRIGWANYLPAVLR